MRAKLLALNRHIRNTNGRAQPVHPRSPRFAHSIPGRFHDRIVDFLELHSRPAHPDESDKRSQHFIAAFTDLVDTRIAQHSLQRKIDKVSRAAINLKCVIDHFPKPLSREDFEHGRLDHVILQAAVDERRCNRGHCLHRVSVCRHAGDLLFHQVKFTKRFVELFPRMRVLDRQAQTGFGRSCATRAKCRPPKIEHCQCHF